MIFLAKVQYSTRISGVGQASPAKFSTTHLIKARNKARARTIIAKLYTVKEKVFYRECRKQKVIPMLYRIDSVCIEAPYTIHSKGVQDD
jgi:hypothetical protein